MPSPRPGTELLKAFVLICKIINSTTSQSCFLDNAWKCCAQCQAYSTSYILMFNIITVFRSILKSSDPMEESQNRKSFSSRTPDPRCLVRWQNSLQPNRAFLLSSLPPALRAFIKCSCPWQGISGGTGRISYNLGQVLYEMANPFRDNVERATLGTAQERHS